MKTRNEGWTKGYEMAVANWAATQCENPVTSTVLEDLEIIGEETSEENLPDLDLV